MNLLYCFYIEEKHGGVKKECLRYKLQKMTFGRDQVLPQKCKNSSKTTGKTTIVNLKIHGRNRERLNMFR